jgi:hypothetical protein
LQQQKRGFSEKNKCPVPLKNIPWNITVLRQNRKSTADFKRNVFYFRY